MELQRGQFSLLAARLRAFYSHLATELGMEVGWELSQVKMTQTHCFKEMIICDFFFFACIFIIL